jgi:ribonucleoside-diphosphate reductase alpha chain
MTVPSTPDQPGTSVEPGRHRLPNRRAHELLSFEHSGIRYTAGVGRFEDGRPAEIFLNTFK